jgi:hypothetical protein
MRLNVKYIFVLTGFIVAQCFGCWATDKTDIESDSITAMESAQLEVVMTEGADTSYVELDTAIPTAASIGNDAGVACPMSIYSQPYSVTSHECENWHRLWINTAVLSGAFIGTLFVLECLPEDATSWNRDEIRSVPLFTRWFRNIFKRGPEWDHDKFYFNYLLHPYAGSVYFMTARSNGFNMWQSLLYCSCISTIGWEFGVEAFMERPSYQDLFITPLVGSAIGEGFYRIKRHIAANDYRLLGSKVLGNVVAFLIDPVNEMVGFFAGNDARHINDGKRGVDMSMSPVMTSQFKGFSLVASF